MKTLQIYIMGVRDSSKYKFLKLVGLLRKHIHLFTAVITLSLIGTGLGLVSPLLTKNIIDEGIMAGSYEKLLYYTCLLIVVYVLGTMVSTLRNYLNTFLSERVAHELRRKIFDKVLELGHEMENVLTGDVVARMLTHVRRLRDFIVNTLQTIILNTLSLAGMLIVVFSLNFKLACIVLAPVPLYALGLLFYQPRIRTLFYQTWSSISKLSAYSTQIIQSLYLVKIFGRERLEKNRFISLSWSVLTSRINAIKYSLKVLPWLELLLSLTSVAVMYFGGIMVIKGEMKIGTLVAFLAYVWQVYGPIRALTGVVNNLSDAQAAYERLQDFLEAKPSIREAPEAREMEIRGLIEIENLWFAYRPGAPVLKGLNLKIQPGEIVGIVGPNGAGKTTLVRILVRFLDAKLGRIKIDGVDYRYIKLDCLRRQVAMATQEPILIPGSVALNIAYGSENTEPAKILEAALACQCHDFIMKLPLAYDSDVGEQGRRLSGGQKQLICLARVFLSKPRILILDEATSSVHVDIEKKALTNIIGCLKDSTIIIISHRPTIGAFVNRIVTLEEGKITGERKGELRKKPVINPITIQVIKPTGVNIRKIGDKIVLSTNEGMFKINRIDVPFPISKPGVLLLHTSPGIHVIIEDWNRMDPESRRILHEEIKRTLNIVQVKELLNIRPFARFAAEVEMIDEADRKRKIIVPIINLVVRGKNFYIADKRNLYLVDLTRVKPFIRWRAQALARTFEGE
ncbi:MAG: hypothetical protein DRJ47_04040 [Thermoprotei archaeon]|nr:MAG: hypothetical protein DRJ47_04040 [Thermoprotei archaeon]